MAQRLLRSPSTASTLDIEEEDVEEGEVTTTTTNAIMLESAAGGMEDVEERAVKRIRLITMIHGGAEPQQRTWAGAVPAKKALSRRAPKKIVKKMRMAFPVGDDDTWTLARGALVDGMVGGKREERTRLITAARELRGASKVWAQAIEEALIDLLPEEAPTLSFGNGANDDIDLCGISGKGVAKHAEEIIAALDHLRAPENAIMAAARGLLVQWPECLPRGVLRCPALHAYLDLWT